MKGKVLIIDDDRSTLTMLKMILSRHGYQTFCAQDGASGLELVSKNKPDAVICDMLIPKMPGLELCKAIKQDARLRETKIILMTGVYKGAAFQSEAKKSGADQYMEKPIDTNELLVRLDKLLVD